MKFEQILLDWKNRELPYKNDLLLNLGYQSWEEYRFANQGLKIGNLVKNQILNLISLEREFDYLDFNFKLLTNSVFAPFAKWNLDLGRGSLETTFLYDAYFKTYAFNLWSSAYENAITRFFNGQELTLIGLYSENLGKIIIVDGCETIIAYLRLLAIGCKPSNFKIFLQTVDKDVEDLFARIYLK